MSDRHIHNSQFITRHSINRADGPGCSAAIHNPQSTIRTPQSAIRNGFTLVEMLVVITLIVLVLAISLPSIVTAFTAGADTQAYNLMAAMLNSARATAMVEGSYAAVHCQLSDRDEHDQKSYLAVLRYDETNDDFEFDPADTIAPLPGKIAFGEISGDYLGGTDDDEFRNLGSGTGFSDTLRGFTTFSVAFDSDGQVVKYPNGNTNGVVISDSNLFGTPSSSNGLLWNDPGGEPGVTAMTIFDYSIVEVMSQSDRQDYLDENGQFLPLNLYTGKFFYRYGQ